jgi:dienelactone hydrolase
VIRVRSFFLAGILALIAASCLSGCTTTGAPPSYSVDSGGILSVSCGQVTHSETVLFKNGTYTLTRIVMHTQNGDVVTYLSAPAAPKAAVVYAPGAGEKPDGHIERMARYAASGYAFLFADTRGNGGETPGIPFGPQLVQQDFAKFEKGEWPQYYQTVCDLSAARRMLAERYSVPVYAMGSSNGGRYAAVVAGADPAFAGYAGISTSDWGVKDAFIREGYTGNAVRFAASLEPGTYMAKISPRPVWIFHAEDDPVIPQKGGKELFSLAGEPRYFSAFAGSHGINSDADDRLLAQWAQIYGTQG